ncbi:ankyrin [Lophiostoma macrostomum CBS 122681]|uniref:Ankyrin n=1 Tax=Lophiostoma macrostomum CBS 122681 TaxID=1314788 RepID=A0A6A6SWY8_9PLEO|nr:ankyrin [Lophiostoma macrostomum CBS 122681]
MVDPLTTLSAASNVVQFIELVIKIVGKSRAIHKSASGVLDEHKHLEDVTTDLGILTGKLRGSITVSEVPTCFTEDEQALSDLCAGCLEVSGQLAAALSRLKGKGNVGAFRSLRQAFKCVWNKDDIDNLEKTVRVRNVDVLVIQQSERFASLDESTQTMIQTLNSIHTEAQINLQEQDERAIALHSHTVTVVADHALEIVEGQDALRQQVNSLSVQTDQSSREVLDAQAHANAAAESWMSRNLAEHQRTRDEMQRFKDEAETQVITLTEEIRLLKIELEASVKHIAATIGTVSKKKQREMKEISNAKFALWVAKEIILEKLKAFLALFRFNFTAEAQTNAAQEETWKLLPYPRPGEATTRDTSSESLDVPLSGPERSLAWATSYHNLRYSIAARNVPLVRKLLEEGADPNARSPGDGDETLLDVAIASAYERTQLDTVSSVMLMRRHAMDMIRLLLEFGAGAEGIERMRANPRPLTDHITKHLPDYPQSGTRLVLDPLPGVDWTIQQLLDARQHPYFRDILSLVDATWSGDLEEAKRLLLGRSRRLCTRADVFRASPLGAAVLREDEAMVNLFLEHGASPDVLDATGCSPLAIAVHSGNEAIIRLLVSRGVDITIRDKVLGITAIEYAMQQSKYACCSLMLTSNNQTRSNLLRFTEDYGPLLSRLLTEMARASKIPNLADMMKERDHYLYSQKELIGTNVEDLRSFLKRWEGELREVIEDNDLRQLCLDLDTRPYGIRKDLSSLQPFQD